MARFKRDRICFYCFLGEMKKVENLDFPWGVKVRMLEQYKIISPKGCVKHEGKKITWQAPK